MSTLESSYAAYIPVSLKLHLLEPGIKLRPARFRLSSILFAAGGSGRLQLDEVWYDLQPGCCFLWQPPTNAQLQASADRSLKLYLLQYVFMPLDREYLQNTGLSEFPTSELHSAHVDLHSAAFVETMLSQLLQAFQVSSTPGWFRKQSLFHEILELLSVSVDHSGLPLSIRRTIRYMERHFAEPLQIGQLPELAGLTPSSYSRAFKKATGMTPTAYLTRLRVERAKELLKNSHLTLKEIARSVGYQDELYFSRVFKNNEGIPPSMFVKEETYLR
jgi:AraC family transcriptional regulator, transcriptional activator for feuABC-ybbA operon